MRSDVLLVSTVGTLLFLASASQGLRCYGCNPCNNEKGGIGECPERCWEIKGTDSSGPIVLRGCSANVRDIPLSGCKQVEYKEGKFLKGKICACKTDLCNLNLSRGYTMSYQWITLAASLLIAVSVHDIVL